VLLLAEGDIIALMGGDITPGACYELERLQQQQQLSGQQQQEQQQLSGQQQQQSDDGPKASLDSCSNRDTITMTMSHPVTVNSTNIAATANANHHHINNSIPTKTTTTINNSSHNGGSNDPHQFMMRGWKVGKLILAGEKIHIRHPKDQPLQSQRMNHHPSYSSSGHHHHHHHRRGGGGSLSKANKSSNPDLSSLRSNDGIFATIATTSNGNNISKDDNGLNTDYVTSSNNINNYNHVDNLSNNFNYDTTHHHNQQQQQQQQPNNISYPTSETPTTPTNDRHRTLSPESTEILNLSGDVRCFRMAETPIAAFLQQTVFKSQHKSSSSLPSSSSSTTTRNMNTDPQHPHPSTASPSDGSSNITYHTVSTMNSDNNNNNNNNNDDAMSGQHNSFVRQLFTSIITTENMRLKIIITSLTACCVLLRVPLLRSHYGDGEATLDDWLIGMLLPITTTIMFSLSIACPIALVIAEAVVTADLLASTEVTLLSSLRPSPLSSSPLSSSTTTASKEKEKEVSSSAAIDSNSTSVMEHVSPDVNGDKHAAPDSSHSNIGGGRGRGGDGDDDDDDDDDDDGKSDDVEEGGHSSSSGSSNRETSPQADEFLDEDIDERAEEIADEVNTKVHWYRYFFYMFRTIQHRLLLVFSATTTTTTSISSSSNGGVGVVGHDDDQYYLPIPLASTRLLEVLGAITMVCFIDDDVICEGYSVTEEIFLLMDNHNENNNNYEESVHQQKYPLLPQQNNDICNNSKYNNDNNYQDNNNLSSSVNSSLNNDSSYHAATADIDGGDIIDTLFSSHPLSYRSKAVMTGGSLKIGGGRAFASVKGMVLDLHASPEATGSRFENPLWWRYLPR
jgi:hypothetical protein